MFFFFFKQKTAYDVHISYWSSDVCSSDLGHGLSAMTVSIGKVHSAGGAAAYFAADNYYTAEQSEAVSAWAGEGAKDLGLSGTVDTATFERILNGELPDGTQRSEEHTSELQSLMRISYAVFCLTKKK